MTAAQRYERYVIRQAGCWDWSGYKNGQGYAIVRGDDSRNHKAHRLSWRLHRGDIPKGMCVCHRCDNPPCTNPDHLFLGTNSDNVRDAVRKGRFHGVPGEANGRAKLTEADVIEIRRLRGLGRSYLGLSRLFGVSDMVIRNVALKLSWRHVQ